MKVVRFRLRDTGIDQEYFSDGLKRIYVLERQKAKNWEQVLSAVDKHPVRGFGLEQGISNCRFTVHKSKGTIHAYQIDDVDLEPVIAVPEGYEIEELVRRGTKSWQPADWFRPTSKISDEGWNEVFSHYGQALEYLRQKVGKQQYEYDDYTG